VEKYGTAGHATDDNIIRRMRFACWITNATDTHSEYLVYFARQQTLRERAPMLRYTCKACLYSLVGPNSNQPNECFQMAGDLSHTSVCHIQVTLLITPALICWRADVVTPATRSL
jgi:hypothetical protein